MIKKINMKLEKIYIILSLLFIFLSACSSNQLKSTADSCIIFDQKKNWYKATKKSNEKWQTPIAFILSVVKHESSFKQFAKPKRKKILGFIPGKRPSTAFGYAQVTNPTWQWYKTSTQRKNASRANFNDITDFIGWYTHQSYKILGIDKNDFYNQYLAYHEGHGGWKKESYHSKKSLIEVAKKVEITAKKYNNQLIQCEEKLNKKGIFGLF
ncbi:MAG: hypothetical protein CMP16_00955 [Rickettsiales bacterium]|nr:hypothetical protein [Rickettsiales bacterium]